MVYVPIQGIPPGGPRLRKARRQKEGFSMIYGIADVGSNTVRLSIYKCEGREIRLLMNRKTMAGLAGYVRHGALTPEGIEVACQTLQGYRSLMDNLELPDLRVFATASLRNISNTEEAVGAVMAATGLRVDVLSGREEAELSFRGAIQNAGLYNGLLVDLGGGSTELVAYRNRTIQSACSLSVGSLSLFSRHVEKLWPDKGERRAIRRAVEEQLDQFAPQRAPARHICGVGGTVRAACKVANVLFGRPAEDRSLDRVELKEMLRRLKKPEKAELRLLLKTVPDRIHTIIPGLLALDTIVRAYGAQTITASACGVREGYLLDRVLREPAVKPANTAITEREG